MASSPGNVWTGGPLLALWVGSRVQGGGPPTMTAVFVVVVTLALISFALVWALGRLSRAYEQMVGQARPCATTAVAAEHER